MREVRCGNTGITFNIIIVSKQNTAPWWRSAICDKPRPDPPSLSLDLTQNKWFPETAGLITLIIRPYRVSVCILFGARLCKAGSIVAIGTSHCRTKCSFLSTQLAHRAVKTLEPVAQSTGSSGLQPRMEASAYLTVSIIYVSKTRRLTTIAWRRSVKLILLAALPVTPPGLCFCFG